jgi:hypothetical protein
LGIRPLVLAVMATGVWAATGEGGEGAHAQEGVEIRQLSPLPPQ